MSGAKALPSKMAPEAPFGHFRRLTARFLAIWRLEFAVIRQFRGTHPLEIILDLLRNAIKSKIRANRIVQSEFYEGPKNYEKNNVRRKMRNCFLSFHIGTLRQDEKEGCHDLRKLLRFRRERWLDFCMTCA